VPAREGLERRHRMPARCGHCSTRASDQDVAADYSDRGENRDLGHQQKNFLTRGARLENGSELARRIFTSHCWSVQPCVRPVSAVHMAAGHNALRGSGPGQNLAFENAMARVGCPDRWVDRLCITCCSPSQPSHHAGCRRDLITPQVRRVPYSSHLWPSWPKPSSRSFWRARSRRPSLAAGPTAPQAKAGVWCHGSWHTGSPQVHPL
jgi:hypothetical protein